jgi:hypothetical protein
MQPEDRATADRVWSTYTQLAGVIRQSVHIPDAVVLTTRDLLLLADDRAYWKKAAEEQVTVAVPASPDEKPQQPDVVPEPLKPEAVSKPLDPASIITKPLSSRTPERIELLKARWDDTTLSIADILQQINALPGAQIKSTTLLYSWAGDLRLTVPRSYCPPPPVRIRQGSVIVKAGHMPLTREDNLEEARNLLAAGVPVIRVAEEVGLDKSEVFRMKEEMARRKAGDAD